MSDKKLAARVAKELAAIAFASADDYVSVEYHGGECKFALKKNISKSKRRAICAIRKNKDGIVVETPDKLKAIELLGKYLGMFQGGENAGETPVIIEGVIKN